ncbi:MarR family winged helix-turn-helix transcriptional regulator [Paenibacillus aquistagni]|uniref:DNA-binding transcriptional regulator, MarR family n=1 Tax=Paenibacillus aquistagni TaxID=1852522 RepID=A0A1X7L5W6_9BACL|nr:MarR family transcriptional regulator [Paenibacillus aquistagni]SMG49150.1 DNA-binding transcriptional regulator, MarR family [Paenibacillus aquistagni]
MSEHPMLLDLPILFKKLIKRATQEWNRRVDEEMSMNQFRLLCILRKQGSTQVNELAEKLGVTAGAITGMADKLMDRGRVVRTRISTDRRAVLLEITEEGNRCVDTLVEKQGEMLAALFGTLSPEDMEHLQRIFSEMLDRLEQIKEE